MVFLKKYKLPLIIAAAAILVGLAIMTTVLIINAPKIFVKSAEDFLKDTAKKEIYVLRDNITVNGDLELTDDLDIDLNKNTLTVNGTLKITLPDDKAATINIGTVKKKAFVAGGRIIADDIEVVARNTTLNIYSDAKLSGNINVKKLNLNAKLEIAETEALTLSNAEADINADISGTLNLNAATLTLRENAVMDQITADSSSSAIIYGKINTAITGGNEITLLGQASCPLVKDVQNLYYQQQTASIGKVENAGQINIVEKLAAPKQLNIEQSGKSFKCIAALVNNADKYIFTIKDNGGGIIKTIESASTSPTSPNISTNLKPTAYPFRRRETIPKSNCLPKRLR